MQSAINPRSSWCGGGQSGRLGIEFGHAQVEGVTSHPIEDYHVAKVKQFGHGDRIGLFAIFDGHGGSEVAKYLKENLFDVVLEHPKFSTDTQLAIRESFMAIDQRILDMGETSRAWRAGSTATTAFLMDKGRLIVANVGDSRAILSRGKVAIDLSVDHEPQKPQEREMIESKGGEVSRIISGDVYRVDMTLAMSRAFGDYTLKAHITVEPDIWDDELTADDEFFIIASDGLWHVMSSQEAVDLAREAPGAKEAAKALIQAAVRRHSRDDISVLVVGLGVNE
ncbi:probable protein phosphatase 2C 20 [Cryptomeria japonica]|uniref:probable protein phosphatase 2C 20 n=1 Tax=Cryptomeria japonica TaxID=3369 RepID=UPI0025ACF8CB|nr:probable protein phosphatase 2C 20 [Cryptomeria japonica]